MRQIKTSSRNVNHVVRYEYNLEVFFVMGTRVSYPIEIKMKAIEMRLQGVSSRIIMEELNIVNESQIWAWMRWYKKGELHRLEQPVGKQYAFGKGPNFTSETEKLQTEIRFLKQQLDVLKKFSAWERRWKEKSQ